MRSWNRFRSSKALRFDGEIEVTSYRGAVREACLWPVRLAGPGVRRRASILEEGDERTQSPIPNPMNARCARRRWIIDPDGAVVRAGLCATTRARHGLWQLDADIAYLSGTSCRPPSGVRGDRTAGVRRTPARQALAALDCGALEILVRGVQVDPDALRRRLRLARRPPLSAFITAWVPGLPVTRLYSFAGPATVPRYADGGYFQGAPPCGVRGHSTMRLLLAPRAGFRCSAGVAGGRKHRLRVPPGRHRRNGGRCARARLEPRYMLNRRFPPTYPDDRR